MTQTLALFLDAYRELNAKRMFWVTLVLSALVVAAFAAVGLNERGFTVLWFEIEGWFNSKFVSKPMFYHYVFGEFGVKVWLAFVATALALISTAGLIPDLIAGGAIDLFVSKPISRARLFFTKYAAGLLFATLQVTFFSVAAYFVIGIKSESWDAKLFIAIPLAVLSFSYLFAACALLGLLTRSTVAALMLTLLFWFLTLGLSRADTVFMEKKIAAEAEQRGYAKQLTQYADLIKRLEEQRSLGPGTEARLESSKRQRDDLVKKRDETEPRRQTSLDTYQLIYNIRTFLPKTDDISHIIERQLDVKEDEIVVAPEDRADNGGGFFGMKVSNRILSDSTSVNPRLLEVRLAARKLMRERTNGWVIGTSLGFEAVLLALATWIFCRRDF